MSEGITHTIVPLGLLTESCKNTVTDFCLGSTSALSNSHGLETTAWDSEYMKFEVIRGREKKIQLLCKLLKYTV